MKELQNDPGRICFQSYIPLENFDLVEEIWTNLLKKSPHSYFTSWGWISTWIKSLPDRNSVAFVVGYRENEPVLAFFLGKKKRSKYGLVPTCTMTLNATGDLIYDRLHIEYNSVLSEQPMVMELMSYLSQLDWDELILPGASRKFVSDLGLTDGADNIGNFYVIFDEVDKSYFVDLEKVRSSGMDFLKLLSANRRSQIRRSVKQYQLDGEIEILEASDIEQALVMFDDMVALHQQEWNKRGKPGAFSNDYLSQFHRQLIRNRFAYGEIQLLKIKNDKIVLGYLYCFVYHGDVLFYQSGFRYAEENVYRPGVVSHYHAVIHNAAKGLKTYDFLAGGAGYKSSLSTDAISMYWIRILKSRNRFVLEKSVIGLKNYIKSMPLFEKYLRRFVTPL